MVAVGNLFGCVLRIITHISIRAGVVDGLKDTLDVDAPDIWCDLRNIS